MASFAVLETKEEIESFYLPLNQEVKLLQMGGDAKGNYLEVALVGGFNPGIGLNVLRTAPGSSTVFSVRGTISGTKADVTANLGESGGQPYVGEYLHLTVFGEPHPHPGYSVDLLSKLPLSGRSDLILAYVRIMLGDATDTNIVAQDRTKPALDCGDVAASYGPMLFGKAVSKEWIAFYKPPKSSKRADLRFDPQQVRHKISRIRALLDNGIAVRVWVVDSDKFSFPVIYSDAESTHFITIVGYGQNKFLFIDPWPTGSKMEYDGGMFAKKMVNFLGELEFDPLDLEKGIRSPSVVSGAMGFTVVAGPQ